MPNYFLLDIATIYNNPQRQLGSWGLLLKKVS